MLEIRHYKAKPDSLPRSPNYPVMYPKYPLVRAISTLLKGLKGPGRDWQRCYATGIRLRHGHGRQPKEALHLRVYFRV